MDFYKVITDLVSKEMRDHGLRYKDIAQILNVSESFINQVHQANSTKHYNAEHLFVIAISLNISIQKLFPTKESIKILPYWKDVSDSVQENSFNKMIDDLIYKGEE
ncbi:hypothetical protein PT153_03390 [Erysipelothrix rhusiopathiae]|nr:hypothetical protein [Erysipelothrix rhusiopathiae]